MILHHFENLYLVQICSAGSFVNFTLQITIKIQLYQTMSEILDELIIDFRSTLFPLLPPLNEITKETHQGPLLESNKVIEGLYAGAFPGDVDDRTNTLNLIDLLNCGISVFVCLQHELDEYARKRDWINTGMRPYFNDIKLILANALHHRELKQPPPSNVVFIHLPICDLSVCSDIEIIQLAIKLVRLHFQGERIYVHCWGGHGRTGIVVSVMLHIMYGLSAELALAYCKQFHCQRERLPMVFDKDNEFVPVSSPQTPAQIEQVTRIINKLRLNYLLQEQK